MDVNVQLVTCNVENELHLFLFGSNDDSKIFKFNVKKKKFILFDNYPNNFKPVNHSVIKYYDETLNQDIIISCGGTELKQHFFVYKSKNFLFFF